MKSVTKVAGLIRYQGSRLHTLPPTPIPTLLGTPEPEPRSHADILFGSDPAPTDKTPTPTTAATPGVDRRKKAAPERKVAQQTIATPDRPKDAADIFFDADNALETTQRNADTKNTRIAQGEAMFDFPFRQAAPAPKNPSANKTEAVGRQTSERLEDEPPEAGIELIDDLDFVVNPPSDPDPQRIEVELRRKILDAMKRGDDFGASQAKHFLDGNGKERRFTREEARGLKPIRDAEEVNKKRFVKSLLDVPEPARPEILDPDGGPGSPGRTGFRDRLINLGPPIQFEDHWVRKFDVVSAAKKRDFNFVLGSGRGSLRSRGKFSAHREGEAVIVTGVVTHVWDDDYNFDKNALPEGLNQRGWILQQSGRGQVFPFGSTWRQRMTVRIEFKNGEPFISETIWEDQ
jgi:hypothetical protein